MNEVIILIIGVGTLAVSSCTLAYTIQRKQFLQSIRGLFPVAIALLVFGCTLLLYSLQSGNTLISITGVSNLLLGSAFGGIIGNRKLSRALTNRSSEYQPLVKERSASRNGSQHSHTASMEANALPDRIARAVSECTFKVDEELRCKTWDMQCEALFGCDSRLALRSTLPDLMYGVEPLVSENILRQASYSGEPRIIMLPAVNDLPAQTLLIDVIPDGAWLFVHAKRITDEQSKPASQPGQQSAPVFSITNHASALTYVASKSNGMRVTFVSSDIRELFGDGSNGTHITRDLIDRRIHPDDRAKVLRAFQSALMDSRPFSIDYRLIEEQQTVRWYHEEAMPIAGGDGELYGVIVNLNGKLASEETLKNTADHALELLSNGIHTGLIFLKNGRIRYANNAFSNLTGTNADAIRGNAFASIVHPRNQHAVSAWLHDAANNNGPAEMEFDLDCASPAKVEMKLSEVEIFGQQFTLGTVRDITQDLKMEQELTRLTTFPDLNPNPIIEVLSDGDISYINPAALETFPSLPLLSVEHPVILTIVDGLKEFHEQGQPSLYREVGVGDRMYSQLLSRVPATDLIRVYLTDITERCEFENNLANAKQMAETANRLKSEFLANMSHEIRTPLNIILGYTDLVKEVLLSHNDNQCDKYFSYIHNAGGQLTQTIDKIIDISRFHISDFPLAPQVLPFAHMVSECVAGFQVLAKMGNLKLTLETDGQDCLLFADPYAVNEAITNVIGNAIKYTLEGSVDITLETTPDNEIVLRVSDTGVGISEDFLPQIFDEFSQEEGGYGRPFEGTGLGLALTKKFIDASGGVISVDSVKRQGTTFTMTFPAYSGQVDNSEEREEPMIETQEQTPSMQPGEKLNILVVEDDTLTQDFMKILLGKKYEKHFAMSASEANAVLDQHHINIILMDLSIKGNEDGITLTKAIRNHPDWKDIPIIALTAHAFTRDRENAIAAGCNAFFSKPFNRTELLEAIEQLAIP